jgi:hypothetical protein
VKLNCCVLARHRHEILTNEQTNACLTSPVLILENIFCKY